MTGERARPRLHFTAEAGWVNDPLGLTYHAGTYHLFFQYVPGQTEWAPHCHWGHAISADLLHWTEVDVALAPGDGDDGVWSGSLVVPPDGEPLIFYTSVELADLPKGRSRVARPADDGWRTWVKGDVVARMPPGLDVLAYRDPYVLNDGDEWLMVTGAGLADGTATATVHRSPDLSTWTYDGLLATRRVDETDPVWTGAAWECPQLFRLGDAWVLAVSVWDRDLLHHVACAVGTLEARRFTATSWQRLTYGPCYYAGSAWQDRDGTRGLVHWLREVRDPGRWEGAQSLPHVLRLDGGRVVAAPHPNLAARRTAATTVHGPGAADVPATCDLEWTLAQVHDAGGAGADLRLATPDGQTLGAITVAGGTLTARVGTEAWSMPVSDRDVRVVVDGPVCEVFTTGGVLAFPIEAGGERLAVHVGAGGRVTAYEFA